MNERRKRLNPKSLACSIISLGTDQHNIIEERYINDYKGRGVFAKINIEKGSFILHYKGSLIKGKDVDSLRKQDTTYMYFFKHNGEVCIDATDDDGSLGRLVNDSAEPNSKMKKIVLNGTPHLCLFAIKDIRRDEEITYDYGVGNLTWRNALLKMPVVPLLAPVTSGSVSVERTDLQSQKNDDRDQTMTAFDARQISGHEHPESVIPKNDDRDQTRTAFAARQISGHEHPESVIPKNDDRDQTMTAFDARQISGHEHPESVIPKNDDRDQTRTAFAARQISGHEHPESVIPKNDDRNQTMTAFAARQISGHEHPESVIPKNDDRDQTRTAFAARQISGHEHPESVIPKNDDRDQTMTAFAARQISGHEHPESVIPKNDDRDQTRTAFAARQISGHEHPESVIPKNDDRDQTRTAFAARQISGHEHPESVIPKNDDRDQTRTAFAARQILGHEHPESVIPKNDDRDQTRTAFAARQISGHEHPESVIPKNDDRDQTRTAFAARQISGHEHPESVIPKNDDRDQTMTAFAARQISGHEHPESVIPKNDDRDQTRTAFAARQISGHEHPESVIPKNDDRDQTRTAFAARQISGHEHPESVIPKNDDRDQTMTAFAARQISGHEHPESVIPKNDDRDQTRTAFAARQISGHEHPESVIPKNDDRDQTRTAFAARQISGHEHPESVIPKNDDRDQTRTAFAARQILGHEHPESVIPKNDDRDQTMTAFAARQISGHEHPESVIPCQKHNMTLTVLSSLDKCSVCYGPYAPIRWTGLRCKFCSVVWHKSCLVKTTSDEQRPESWDDFESNDDSLSSGDEFVPNSDDETDSSDLEHKKNASPSDVEHLTKPKENVQDPRTENSVDLGEMFDFSLNKLSKKINCKAPCAELTASKDNASNKNYCFVCNKPQSKLSRHFKIHEQEEAEVAKVLSLPKGSKKRKIMLERLRNKGNFQHNSAVISQGLGSLKVKRKSQTKGNSTKYEFCIYCSGMFVRKELWRHARRCHYRPHSDEETHGKRRILGLGAACSTLTHNVSEGVWRMLRNMNQDEVTAVVRNDFCILQLAQSLFSKHGHDTTKHEYVRQKLRELGRLVITLRNKASIHNLEEAIKPANFDKVIFCVKETAGYDQKTNTYSSPSLALKLGHSLHKVCDIVHCRALMSDDDELKKSAKAFEKLLGSKWAENVSARALTTLQESKFNKPSKIPLTEDVQKLHRHLEHKAQHTIREFNNVPSPGTYAELAKVTLTQVILFNRRRAGEVSKMALENFLSRDQAKVHDDVAQGLTDFEQKLCQHFSRVELRGKRGRRIAVLLTPDMVQALTLIVAKREACDVPRENIFLFGIPKCLNHYRGQDSLRHFAGDCGAKNPNHLRSTQLRKQVATVSQFLNLKNNELDQLADFMGHDIRIHREYYRLPESTVQVAKISKLLIAMEKGQLPKLRGKSLDEISDFSVTDSDGDEDCGDSDRSSGENDVSCQSLEAESTVTRRKVVRRPWTAKEVNAVMRHFKPHISKGHLASKFECEKCKKAEYPVLEGRTIQNIRDFVRNKGCSYKKHNEF